MTHSNSYIPVSGTITVTGAGDNDAAKRVDERDKGVIFKNCAPFTDCISNINNAQIDNAQNIDVVLFKKEVYSNIIEMSQLIQYKNLSHSNPRSK